jgi:hypothetical protein
LDRATDTSGATTPARNVKLHGRRTAAAREALRLHLRVPLHDARDEPVFLSLHRVHPPPLTYATRLCIEIAQALLAETDEAAAVIAERVGYGSVDAFSRAFARLTGKAPVLFRRMARGQLAPIVGRATMLRLAA